MRYHCGADLVLAVQFTVSVDKGRAPTLRKLSAGVGEQVEMTYLKSVEWLQKKEIKGFNNDQPTHTKHATIKQQKRIDVVPQLCRKSPTWSEGVKFTFRVTFRVSS